MPDDHPHWPSLVRAHLRDRRLDEDVIEEIAEHLAEVYRDQLLAGRTREEALAAVDTEIARLPALTRAATAARRRPASGLPERPAARTAWVSAFARDLAYAARLVTTRPGVSAVAVLTLALGIGANTAIFSVVNHLFLQPLPFPDPDRLVMTWEYELEDPDDPYVVSAPNWEDWQRQSTSFERMAIWEWLRFNLAGDGEAEQVYGMRTSHGLFPMLGIAPQLGRTFRPDEDAPDHHVAIISDALWRTRFGARPDIVGHVIRVNALPHEIIGVMPPEFIFEQRRHQIWVPIAFNAEDAGRGSHSFRAAARLKPGVTFGAAKAELETIGARLRELHPQNEGESATITPMSELGVAYLKPTLYALVGAVILVLLIACVNVANLLLAQSAVRQREFAVRAALGAGRARIASQLLAEGLLLAGVGGAAGLAFAWLGTTILEAALPPAIRLAPFREAGGAPLDASVLAFTFGIASVTGVLFSLAPLAGLLRGAPALSMRAAGDRAGTARVGGIRGVLVGVEVALAVVVLTGAGLMIRSMERLLAEDPGLDTGNVLLMEIALPQEDFYGPAQRSAFCADLDRELSAVPGVVQSGAISHLPLSGANAGRGLTIEGFAADPEDPPSAFYRVTCPGYFAALGIPILDGRDFTHADATDAAGAVIVNERVAELYWPNSDPVGRRLKLGSSSETPWLTVVGVVQDVRHFGLDEEPLPEIYRPYPQAAWPQMTITVKSAMSPLGVAEPVRQAVRRIDRDQPVTRIRSMADVVDDSVGQRRFPMQLLSVFSMVALALAVVGVYGVVSYIVTQRSREIGIRMALGARAAEVVRMVVAKSLTPIAAGVAVGTAISLVASRLLGSLLYEVEPDDPVVLASIALLLGGCAVVAALVPARRAALVDPLFVLRQD